MRLGSAYAIHGNNGLVKIGCSINPITRIRAIETQMGGNSFDSFYTDRCSNYMQIETIAHRHFKSNRILGEWFKIDFNDAVNYLLNCDLVIPTEQEIEEDNKRSEKFVKDYFDKMRPELNFKKQNYKDKQHCSWCEAPVEYFDKLEWLKSDNEEDHCELFSKYIMTLLDFEKEKTEENFKLKIYDLFYYLDVEFEDELYKELKDIQIDLGAWPEYWTC